MVRFKFIQVGVFFVSITLLCGLSFAETAPSWPYSLQYFLIDKIKLSDKTIKQKTSASSKIKTK